MTAKTHSESSQILKSKAQEGACGAQVTGGGNSRRQRKLSVYLFNVGQGDNIFLKLPNGEYGIIDFFYDTDLNLAEPPAFTYLKKIRRRLKPTTPIVISFICLSHPDNDHVKGARELLNWVADPKNNVQLKNLWMFSGTILEEMIRRYKQYATSRGESDEAQRASETSKQLDAIFKFRERRNWKGNVEYLSNIRKLLDNVDGVRAVGIAPLGIHVQKFNERTQRAFVRFTVEGRKHKTPQQNLISSILMLIYGSHRLLFGGDTGAKIWKDCIKHYDQYRHEEDFGPFQGHFVKASHHGSKHSSAPEIWKRILFPKAYIGISAGRKGSYHHPHRETLKHILAVFPKETERPTILATNSCHDCIGSQAEDKKTFSWMSKRPPLKSQVEESLNRDRHNREKKAGLEVLVCAPACPPKHLAAYIFHFHPNNIIRVFKGISKSIAKADDCLFKTSSSLPFPQCIFPDSGCSNPEIKTKLPITELEPH